jgi:hypothetical protein
MTVLSVDSLRQENGESRKQYKHKMHIIPYELWYISGYVARKWASERHTYVLVPKRLLLQPGKSVLPPTQPFQSGSESHPDPVQSILAAISDQNYIFAKDLFIFAINNTFVTCRAHGHGPRYLSYMNLTFILHWEASYSHRALNP